MSTLQVNISSPVAVILSLILGLQLHQYYRPTPYSPAAVNSCRSKSSDDGHTMYQQTSQTHQPPVFSHDAAPRQYGSQQQYASEPGPSPSQYDAPSPSASHFNSPSPRSSAASNAKQVRPRKKVVSNKPPEINFRPIIGILAQSSIGPYFNFGDYVIFPAHVRWLQMSGANVIPIWANQTQEYYERIIKQINGLYLPGGHSLPLNSTYGQSAKVLLHLAIKQNENGVYFPVWATCLGLQFLFSNAVGEDATYKCEEMYKQTRFYKGLDYENSFIDETVPEEQLPALFDETYMPHMHHFCISMQKYESSQEMKEFFKVVSVNTDDGGTEYISTAQARNYPIYAVQWHPEKFSFHWNMKANTPHTTQAVELGQTLGSFFVSEARRNDYAFHDPHTEEALLIDNFDLTFLGRPSYASFYFFTEQQMTTEALEERKATISKYRKIRFMRENKLLKK